MASLDDFLSRLSATRFAYGLSDCAKTIAAWLVENGHPDLSEPFGVYDEGGAEALLRHFGGLVALCEHGLTSLRVTDQPRRGDVGVVSAAGLLEPMMAICTGKRWALQGRRGVLICPAKCLKAWTV
ncbi:hypothetical protein ABAC460_23095 [Asticcacaulis sp. AC460]|uniref:DUF6950 family protein n=1 Tax=Asticcacaulis sp. AC460 TaxID=1282360 RepID=UPI0003C3FF64|nr:hypothetical protein [Asticcacaulis sp. AC460]ESQ86601.1 hypothetical protein ABAC460_23095 [Asticcacaulis sp. AC460]